MKRHFMQKVSLLYLMAFSLFVSCRQKGSTHELPAVNIDSVQSVSESILNIDTAAYSRETKTFLKQVVTNDIGLKKTNP